MKSLKVYLKITLEVRAKCWRSPPAELRDNLPAESKSQLLNLSSNRRRKRLSHLLRTQSLKRKILRTRASTKVSRRPQSMTISKLMWPRNQKSTMTFLKLVICRVPRIKNLLLSRWKQNQKVNSTRSNRCQRRLTVLEKRSKTITRMKVLSPTRKACRPKNTRTLWNKRKRKSRESIKWAVRSSATLRSVRRRVAPDNRTWWVN